MEVGQPYPYKGFWIRLVAALIDGIVLAIIVIFLAVLSLLFFGATLGEGAGVGMFFLVLILASLATILYKPIMEASSYQGTFGKYALGLKVVDKNGQRITMTSSFLRTILYIIGAQAFLLCLGIVMIGFTEYKQGLHDILANTYVVTNYWEGPVPLEDNFGG
ncbi:MAG: RDD family protein [Candidatus Poseidoniales archaeon]